MLHVRDFDDGRDELLASVLFGEILNDETCRYKKGFRIMTSPVVSCSNNEFKTQTGSLYISDKKYHSLIIAANEWYLMREKQLSPNELVSLRADDFQLNDTKQH